MPSSRAFDRGAPPVQNRGGGNGVKDNPNSHMPGAGETEARQAFRDLINAMATHADALREQLPYSVTFDLAAKHKAAADAFMAWRPTGAQ